MECDLAPLGGAIGEQEQIANLDDLQRGSGDACLVDQLRRIEQTVEVETSSGPQVSAQLFGELLLALDPLAVTRGRELHHPLMSERRGGVDGEELPEQIEFQDSFAGVWDEAGRIHRCEFYGTGRARLTNRARNGRRAVTTMQVFTSYLSSGDACDYRSSHMPDTLIRRLISQIPPTR
jgi:hypothetical protein